MMRGLMVGVATAAMLLLGSAQAISAEDTALFPDASGKMVRIPIAHSYDQCRKNGRHLGYSDADSHAWCTQHCDAEKKLCQ